MLAATLLLTAGAGHALVPAEDARLASARTACSLTHIGLEHELDALRTNNALIAIAGALIAATGGVLAGFSSGQRRRQVSAIVAVAGAVIPLLPQLFQNPEELQKRFLHADRHFIAGEKAFAQLEDLTSDEARREHRKFAKARFIECAARSPDERVPDFPVIELAPSAAAAPPAAGSARPAASDGPPAAVPAVPSPVRYESAARPGTPPQTQTAASRPSPDGGARPQGSLPGF
jgi:hypothetical protein